MIPSTAPNDSLVLARVRLRAGVDVTGECVVRADERILINPLVQTEGGLILEPLPAPIPDRAAAVRYDVAAPTMVLITHPTHFAAARAVAESFHCPIIAPDFIRRDGAPPNVQWVPRLSSPAAGVAFTYARPQNPFPHAFVAFRSSRRILQSPMTARELPQELKEPLRTIGSPLTQVRFRAKVFVVGSRAYQYLRVLSLSHSMRHVRELLRRLGFNAKPELPPGVLDMLSTSNP